MRLAPRVALIWGQLEWLVVSSVLKSARFRSQQVYTYVKFYERIRHYTVLIFDQSYCSVLKYNKHSRVSTSPNATVPSPTLLSLSPKNIG
jgi:hypothetical protein